MRPSRGSQGRFADLCSDHEVLRGIDRLFQSQDFEPADPYTGTESGQRRSRVGAYHAAIDLDDPRQVARLVQVYAEAVTEWIGRDFEPQPSPAIRTFIRGLRRDGVPIDDTGQLSSAPTSMLALERVVDLQDPQVLHDHLRRIGENIDQDPALTIGSAKELIESICRMILRDAGSVPSKDAGLKDLYKETARHLGLDREAVPGDDPSSKAARNALQAMQNVVGSLAEMRNAMGTGHGTERRSPALGRHARMAAHAAQGVGGFLLETWNERRASHRV